MHNSIKNLRSISIILPCYNEEENIAIVVREAHAVSSQISDNFEIIIVNDGSTDKTLEVATRLGAEYSQVRVISQENKGYGGALKTGFASATKEWLFFTDSDRQFDLRELSNLVEYTDQYDFVFGYRKKRADKPHRLVIASMLKIWNRVLLNFPIYIKDIDCAFKLMRRASFEEIGPIQSSGAMISTEFILKIVREGYRIKQIPVSHHSRISGQSTGSNIGVILKAIKETFELRKTISGQKKEFSQPQYSPMI